MSRPLNGAVGQVMALEEYYADFERNFSVAGEFWKLERGQTFAEPGDDSWEAFDSGDWEGSMCLLRERRDDLIDYHRGVASAGTQTYRIRIVDTPITPYLQWELNLLKVRDETGGPIRVLSAQQVEHLEDLGSLPDIYTMDDRVMYQAVYDDNGVMESARRFDDKDLIKKCRTFIAELYISGEPISSFFRREIEPLPPAKPGRPSIPRDYLESKNRPGPIRS